MNNLIQEDFINHWKENQTSEEYHSNKNAVNSSSLIKIRKSPKSFKAAFLGEPKKPTDAMKFGTLVHTAILEGKDFDKRYAVMPEFGDLRKKENKEAKLEWEVLNEGRIFCSQEELDKVLKMIDSVMRHNDAFNLLKNGKTEVSGYFRDEETGIIQKIRPDFISNNLKAELDIKTTIDCSLEAFSKSIWNYRYDFQRAMYRAGIKAITGKEVEFSVFLAIEKEEPYECAVYIADDGMLDKAEQDYREALNKLKESIDNNYWESYQTRSETIGLPIWAYNQ